MLRLRLLLAPAAALGAALAAAPAARAQDYVRTGWYVGARGVYAVEDFDLDTPAPAIAPTKADAENDFGFNLLAGYRLFKGLASDFEFEYVDAIPVRGRPAGPNFDVRTFNLSWNFRLYPLAWAFAPGSPFQRVQPYLAAGVSNQWVQLQRLPSGDKDEGNFAGRLGAGLDFYLTENVALTSNGIYTLGAGDVKEFRYWSIGWGLLYRFGGGEDSSAADDEDEEAEE